MAKRKSYGAELENRRIQVWWPLDSRYYTCRVLKFNERSRKHKVKYEDSDEENLDLSREKWRMVLDDPPEEAEAGKELVDEGRGQGKDGEVVMVGEEPREGIVAMDTSKMRAAVDSSPRTRKTRVRLRGKNSGAGNSMGQLTPRRGPGRPKGVCASFHNCSKNQNITVSCFDCPVSLLWNCTNMCKYAMLRSEREIDLSFYPLLLALMRNEAIPLTYVEVFLRKDCPVDISNPWLLVRGCRLDFNCTAVLHSSP